MSKLKLSFSLILAIFLVGILSSAVFASNSYGLTAVPNTGTGGFTVSFHGLDNTTDPTGTSFTVQLFDKTGTTPIGSYQTGTLGSDTSQWPYLYHGSVELPSTGVTANTTYEVKLYRGTDTTGAVIDTSYAVYSDSSNALLLQSGGPSKTSPDGKTTLTVDVTGSGLVNANDTGLNDNHKNRANQKIHGFYQNNSNSCASCHQTHTSPNGEALLFKDGVYSTCSACHDGTTGAYNSFSPVAVSDTASIAGTFSLGDSTHNGSLHEADGSLNISAAPGGGKADSNSTAFNQEFDCASCHAAHGGGSAGENNLNTDPMGWGAVPYSGTPGQPITYFKGHGNVTITSTDDNKNGKLFTFNDSQIIDLNNSGVIPTAETTPYILVKTTATTSDIQATLDKTGAAKGNYFWTRAGVTAGDLVIQTYRWDGTNGYKPDYSLWNRELGYPYVANTIFKDGQTTPVDITADPNLKEVWKDGFAFGSRVADVHNATISLGIDVETAPYNSNANQLFDSKAPGYTVDAGVELSKYCASCHTDYLSAHTTDSTGVYTDAHRHATDQDKLTCVRCHYAHGSQAQIMHDANDNTYWNLTAGVTNAQGTTTTLTTTDAISYLADPNPSSALKRYTGMTVCYACHGKGEQFVGSNSGSAPDQTTGQYLMGGDPGTTRSVITK